jgi:hypothetical protein
MRNDGQCLMALAFSLSCRAVLYKIWVPPPTLSTNLILAHIESIYEPGSSVGIRSDYELDGQGSIPDRGRGFFL